jgi:hypothetical protein
MYLYVEQRTTATAYRYYTMWPLAIIWCVPPPLSLPLPAFPQPGGQGWGGFPDPEGIEVLRFRRLPLLSCGGVQPGRAELGGGDRPTTVRHHTTPHHTTTAGRTLTTPPTPWLAPSRSVSPSMSVHHGSGRASFVRIGGGRGEAFFFRANGGRGEGFGGGR